MGDGSRLAPVPRAATGTLRGQRVGDYVLIERLGGGAMATVYRAVDQTSGRQVAVKVLMPDADIVMRERFHREATTHSNLVHPNIVRILDVGQADSGLTYIAMELVFGSNLSEVMEETLRFSPADAACLLEPIALALDYSSREGIVHRDVKPSNVLLRRAEAGTPGAVRVNVLNEPVVPLLSDFGIARALDAPELTNAGRTIGTPTYMSPEQCSDSHEIDGRSDLYSLGAVFYRCIVGRPPFGGTTTQILHAHVYDPLTIPDEMLAKLPPLAVQILRRSLAKEPDHRYATGAEMAIDLHRLANLSPEEATPLFLDDTATMESLPSVRTGTSVLVPAPIVPSPGPQVAHAPEYVAPELHVSKSVTALGVPAVRRGRRWAGMVLGTVLAALVLSIGGGIVLNLLPGDLFGSPAHTPAPAAVAIVTNAFAPDPTPFLPPEAASPTEPAVLPPVEPAPLGTGAAMSSASAQPPSSVPTSVDSPSPAQTATPTVLPTPAGSIENYWEDARAAYEERDWQVALDFITLVRRIDARYKRETIDPMLFEIHVGLAARAIGQGQMDQALRHLDDALAIRPDAGQLAAIQRALQALVSPNTLNKVMARWTLATELLVYGQSLLTAENPCAAADQVEAASKVLPDSDVAQFYAESQAACAKAQRDATVRKQLAQLSGRLIYSTQEGDRYRIYAATAEPNGGSALLIEDGAQPARQHQGTEVAFHSTREGDAGIALFDLAAGFSPDKRTGMLVTAPEDGRDAPPSWSANDRMVAYASTVAGNHRSNIFVVENGGSSGAVNLGLGRDPAWHPTQNRIVFNGVSESGEAPGLWLMNGDGSGRLQLTDNGNDLRPAWSPDGRFIFFMSQRDGNWDVYRLELGIGSLLQLTNDPAQDGLPAVSPDGKWVAFASDRDGYWRIWIVPSAGGEALPLLTVNGVLTSWLEHALQWIP